MTNPSCDNCIYSTKDGYYPKCTKTGYSCSTEMSSNSMSYCSLNLRKYKPDPNILSNDEIKEMIHERKIRSSSLYRIKYRIIGFIISIGGSK